MKKHHQGNFHISKERIRWSDMDTAGIMYFGKYTRLFEIAETDLMAACGAAYTPDIFDIWQAYPLRKTFNMEFFSPLFINEEVEIHNGVAAIGRASFTLYFEVIAQERQLCTGSGTCTIVFVGKEHRRPCSIPDAVRRGLEHYILEEKEQ